MIIEVSSGQDIEQVVRLAREIWTDHYEPIIGSRQVEYMLDKFQSVEAISEQIANQGYCYYLIRYDNTPVGYLGIQRQERTLFLSKLYVRDSVRGQGLGREAVNFTLELARDKGLAKIQLTVNKYNTVAIAAYESTGFTRTQEIVTDIGDGYVMDDYVFELEV